MFAVVKLGNKWDSLLSEELAKPYYNELRQRLKHEYATTAVYPHMNHIFEALRLTDYDAVKVVILGQDPYHNEGQAHGLSFSVPEGIAKPPSLQNIFREVAADIGCQPPSSGCLVKWATQGVLLLNATLTVRAGQPNSHSNLGWQTFTDHIIRLLDQRKHPLVFMLWGGYARRKTALITAPQHLVLQAAHPSPLSVTGFRGCKHFSKANDFLVSIGDTAIDWELK